LGEEENMYKNSPASKMENKHGITDVSMNFQKEQRKKIRSTCAETNHVNREQTYAWMDLKNEVIERVTNRPHKKAKGIPVNRPWRSIGL
jgi:hypothetical protein